MNPRSRLNWLLYVYYTQTRRQFLSETIQSKGCILRAFREIYFWFWLKPECHANISCDLFQRNFRFMKCISLSLTYITRNKAHETWCRRLKYSGANMLFEPRALQFTWIFRAALAYNFTLQLLRTIARSRAPYSIYLANERMLHTYVCNNPLEASVCAPRPAARQIRSSYKQWQTK